MLLADELIGLRVKVADAKDPGKKGVSGRVSDETKNILEIETKEGKKKIPKAESVFDFFYEGKWVRVEGKLLVASPEDRIKRAKHLSRKWRLPKFFFKRK